MTGGMGSQGANPQCTFLSISSRKPEVRPYYTLFEIKLQSIKNQPVFCMAVLCIFTYTSVFGIWDYPTAEKMMEVFKGSPRKFFNQ
jgi:hypothetical protein